MDDSDGEISGRKRNNEQRREIVEIIEVEQVVLDDDFDVFDDNRRRPDKKQFSSSIQKSNTLRVTSNEVHERSNKVPRSLKRNLSRSFNNLIEGIRSRTTPLFSRHTTPTRANKKPTIVIGETKTMPPLPSSSSTNNTNSPSPKTSSLCSLSICEGNKKKKLKRNNDNKKKLHSSQQLMSTGVSRSGVNIKEQLSSYQLSSHLENSNKAVSNEEIEAVNNQIEANGGELKLSNEPLDLIACGDAEDGDERFNDAFKKMGNETSEINKPSTTTPASSSNNNKDAGKPSALKNFLSRMSTTEDSIDDLTVSGGGGGVATTSLSMPRDDSATAATVESNLDAATIHTSATIPLATTTPPLVPVYYELKIRLKEGRNLAIRDIGGSSDPYVKFILNGSIVYKSKIIFKNLNPQWNEELSLRLILPSTASSSKVQGATNLLNVENPPTESNPLLLIAESPKAFLSKFKLKASVYDYDRGFLSDDLIGHADIELDSLKENVETPIEVELKDESLTKIEFLGHILMDLTLVPKYTVPEDKEAFVSSSTTTAQASNKNQTTTTTSQQLRTNRRAPYQLWQCVLNVVLVEANLNDKEYDYDPYVKIRLENERYRSKTIRRSATPRFLEQFQLYVYDTNKMALEVALFDYNQSSNYDDFLGKGTIDLKSLEPEKTHFVKMPLENDIGTVSLLLSVTGTYGGETDVTDANNTTTSSNKEAGDSAKYRENIFKKYGFANSLKDIDDVGWLQVKVVRAEGLASADINGKSDPFCAIQIINQYVQTHTEYKTLNPEWGKTFEFNINDIHAVLEITVLDEDKNKVYEFLGKLAIPLINIQNGKRKMYALKDMKLMGKTKGAIELEMYLIYNPVIERFKIKAVIRTFNPREEKYMKTEPKLKVPVLKQNIMRIHNLVQGVINTGNFIDSCFRWVDPVRSVIAFAVFIFLVSIFQIYMLPLLILLIFLKNYIVIKIRASNSSFDDDELNFEDCLMDDDDTITDAEPKKSFREKLAEIQEICLKIQEALDYIASMGERVVNTFMFTTPWLTWLAIIVLLIASLILYLVPLRYLLLAWGVNKFTKKFRKPPDYVDNTEILDFLSRVPSKKEIFEYRELKLDRGMSISSSQSSGGSPQSPNALKKRNKKA